jgi:hypothetical protein
VCAGGHTRGPGRAFQRTGAGQRLYVSLLADRGGQPDADPTNHEVEVPVRVG